MTKRGAEGTAFLARVVKKLLAVSVRFKGMAVTARRPEIPETLAPIRLSPYMVFSLECTRCKVYET